MIFRIATDNDFDACAELFAIGEEDTPNAYMGVPDSMLLVAIQKDQMLVAEENGVVVGMVAMFPPPFGDYAMLDMIVVDRAHRGGTLAPALIAEAQGRSGKSMAIVVPHALDSFVAAGFEQKGYLVVHE